MVYGILPFSFLFHPLGHKDQRIPVPGDPEVYALNPSSTSTYVGYGLTLPSLIRIDDWLNQTALKYDINSE